MTSKRPPTREESNAAIRGTSEEFTMIHNGYERFEDNTVAHTVIIEGPHGGRTRVYMSKSIFESIRAGVME